MGMYYSYFKTIVKADALSQGVFKLYRNIFIPILYSFMYAILIKDYILPGEYNIQNTIIDVGEEGWLLGAKAKKKSCEKKLKR